MVKADYLGYGLGLQVKKEKDTLSIGSQSGNVTGIEEGQFLSNIEHLRLYTPSEENM